VNEGKQQFKELFFKKIVIEILQEKTFH